MISDNDGEGALTPTTIIVVELKKNTLIKIRKLAVFTGDKIKFLIYKTSVGLTVWINNKRERVNRNIKTVSEQMAWAASFLLKNAYRSFKPYMSHFLFKKELAGTCEEPVRKIFNNLDLYFALLG
jgi:hypothetical protein